MDTKKPRLRAGMGTIVALALAVAGCSGPAGTIAPTQQVTSPPTVAPTTPASTVGVVTFGTAYDADTLTIPKPLTRFKATYPEIAWVADLSDSVNATSIQLVVASQSATGVEHVIDRTDVDVSNPKSDTLANSLDLASVVGNKPGTYVLRYIREGTVLAEGTFTLVK